ncbi:DUF2512 family protein [Bacillus sp. CHD6a]|uniref:DUF2512 family protein n=1 Tax=Bacillus sp. CHD6a TaxID=1643452 RepID=UPI0006CDFBA7|nr:DUF2512 family protein [Bacillus sp. CHD6a]KPB06385.1 hypothetical protein AAV98_00890 [Bacillus sp. CHD6a]
MKHVLPLLIKFIASFLILSFFLNQFVEISFLDILLTTVLLITFSYFVVDDLVLPRTNYTFAAVFDFVFNFAVIAFMVYILTNLSGGFLLPSAIAAITITVFEVFFHLYLVKRVFPDHPRKKAKREGRPMELQTEFSEELSVHEKKKRED